MTDNAVNNQSLSTRASGYKYMQTALLWVVGASECAAWLAFGTNVFSQALLGAWGLLMVFGRPKLAEAQHVASLRGDDDKARSYGGWLWVSALITVLSLTSLFHEVMQEYAEERRAASAPVVMAKNAHEQAQQDLAALIQKSPYEVDEMQNAASIIQQLQARVDSERAGLNAQHAKAKSVLSAELSEFWNKTHSSGLSYSAIMMDDGQCTPKTSRYGLMKSAATAICGELQSITGTLPSTADTPSIQTSLNKISALQPMSSYQARIDNARELVRTTEGNLLQASETGSYSTLIYPPMFHHIADLANSFGIPATPERLITLLVAIAVLLMIAMANSFGIEYMETKREIQGQSREVGIKNINDNENIFDKAREFVKSAVKSQNPKITTEAYNRTNIGFKTDDAGSSNNPQFIFADFDAPDVVARATAAVKSQAVPTNTKGNVGFKQLSEFLNCRTETAGRLLRHLAARGFLESRKSGERFTYRYPGNSGN